MKKFRSIIHQIFNIQRGERNIPSDDSLYISKNEYEHRFQNMLPGSKVVITVYLN